MDHPVGESLPVPIRSDGHDRGSPGGEAVLFDGLAVAGTPSECLQSEPEMVVGCGSSGSHGLADFLKFCAHNGSYAGLAAGAHPALPMTLRAMFDQVHGTCLLDRDLDGKGLLYLIWTMFYMGHVS